MFSRFLFLLGASLCLLVLSGCNNFGVLTLKGSGSNNSLSKSLFLAIGDVYYFLEDSASSAENHEMLTRLEDVESFDSGRGFRCTVVSSGDIYCWGRNSDGQLGDGTNTDSPLPVKASSTKSFIKVSTGDSHVCALDESGDIYCWGNGANGALGNASSGNSNTPVQVQVAATFKDVEVSLYAACALTDNDEVYCWGQGFTTATPPVQISTSQVFVSLYGGQNLMCGLISSGAAYCWGTNSNGQLGVGDTSYHAGPTAVQGGHLFSQIVVSSNNIVCGLTLASEIYCWGQSVMGQANQTTPLLVDNTHSFTRLIYDSGYQKVCGMNSSYAVICVSTADGTSTTTASEYPFTDIDSDCGLTPDHFLVCRGNVSNSGSGLERLTPNEIVDPFINEYDFEKIYVAEYDFCAQKSNDSHIYCWGENDYGEFGTGDTNSIIRPTMAASGKEFKDFAIGSDFSCGIDLNGDAYCAGYNSVGTLGNGSTVDSNVFVPVSGGIKFSSIVAGVLHVCGLDSQGAAYCWGENDNGKLGDGTNNDSSIPVAVVGGHHFTKLAPSSNHTCGLKENGDVYCWGENFYGQLGDGTTTSSSSPVKVDSSIIFKDLIGGSYYDCGLDFDGKAYCWGTNWNGELGDGTNSSRSTPIAVQTSIKFSKIDAFKFWYGTTCGMEKDTRHLYCWGDSFDENIFPVSNTPTQLTSLGEVSDFRVLADTLLYKNLGEPVIKKFEVDELVFFSSSTADLDVEVENSYERYCLLENSADVNLCTWVTGPVPSTYPVTQSGFIQLTLFVRQGDSVATGQSLLFFKL